MPFRYLHSLREIVMYRRGQTIPYRLNTTKYILSTGRKKEPQGDSVSTGAQLLMMRCIIAASAQDTWTRSWLTSTGDGAFGGRRHVAGIFGHDAGRVAGW